MRKEKSKKLKGRRHIYKTLFAVKCVATAGVSILLRHKRIYYQLRRKLQQKRKMFLLDTRRRSNIFQSFCFFENIQPWDFWIGLQDFREKTIPSYHKQNFITTISLAKLVCVCLCLCVQCENSNFNKSNARRNNVKGKLNSI